MIRSDGQVLTVQVRGRAITYKGREARVAAFQDVTDLVRAKQDLKEIARRAEEERLRLRTILDTLPVGVMITDAQCRITEHNNMFDQIWGGRSKKVHDLKEYSRLKGWWSRSGQPLRPQDWPSALAVVEGKVTIGEMIDVLRFDGTRSTIMASAAPIRQGETVIGGVTAIQDISRQRELEKEAVEAKEHVELYMDLLTHDINNMNTAVLGYLQLVMGRGDLQGKDKDNITRSLDILESSSHLIDNVKKIKRLETEGAGRRPVDLGKLIEETVRGFSDHPKKKVTINFEPRSKLVVMASGLLRDVFINIIDNAIKHSPGPVTIDISLGKVFMDGREYHRVDIEDDGPGISDDMKDKVFSRLQRGKTLASGTGLGLHLVRHLVEDYHGKVWVEDRVEGDHNKGTRFVVVLPTTHG